MKAFRPNIGDDLVVIVRRLASRRLPRRLLNRLYLALTPAGWEAFYGRFAKIFRERCVSVEPGGWLLRVNQKKVIIPLRRHEAWLDWDAALSVLGHELELKETYRFLANLPHPPRMAFDVGANYGTHSLFLLACGIRTISFEPNPRCHAFFRLICEENRLVYRLEPLALGAEEGSIELRYPERAEWLGTTVGPVKGQPEGHVHSVRVRMSSLDTFVSEHNLNPDLLKLDVEGAELAVLQGAGHVLASIRPMVLFESWRDEARAALGNFFERIDYKICTLPLNTASRPAVLDRKPFLQLDQTNFAAIPFEMLRDWPPRFGVPQ